MALSRANHRVMSIPHRQEYPVFDNMPTSHQLVWGYCAWLFNGNVALFHQTGQKGNKGSAMDGSNIWLTIHQIH